MSLVKGKSLRNLFGRKKKLADADANASSSEDEEMMSDMHKSFSNLKDLKKEDKESTGAIPLVAGPTRDTPNVTRTTNQDETTSSPLSAVGKAALTRLGSITRPRMTRRAKRAELAEQVDLVGVHQSIHGNSYHPPAQDLLTETSDGMLELNIPVPVESTTEPIRKRASSRDRGSRSKSKERGRRTRSSSKDAINQVRARSRERRQTKRQPTTTLESQEGELKERHASGDDTVTTLDTNNSRNQKDKASEESALQKGSKKSSSSSMRSPISKTSKHTESSVGSIGSGIKPASSPRRRERSKDPGRRIRGTSRSGANRTAHRGSSRERRRHRHTTTGEETGKPTISDASEGMANGEDKEATHEKQHHRSKRSSSRERRRPRRNQETDNNKVIESLKDDADIGSSTPKPVGQATADVTESTTTEKLGRSGRSHRKNRSPSRDGGRRSSSKDARRSARRTHRESSTKSSNTNLSGTDHTKTSVKSAEKGSRRTARRREKETEKEAKTSDSMEQPKEQRHTSTVRVVNHAKEEEKQVEVKVSQEKVDTAIEINPALELLSHLGSENAVKGKTPNAVLSHSVESGKSSSKDLPHTTSKENNTKDGLQVENASQVNKKQKEITDTEEDSDIESLDSTDANLLNTTHKLDVLDEEEAAAESVSVKNSVSLPKEKGKHFDSGKSEQSGKNNASSDAASDLLGFLGSNYDEIIEKQNSPSKDLKKFDEDEPKNSIDFYTAANTTAMGGCEDMGQAIEKELDEAVGSFDDSFHEAGGKKLAPPSIAPTAAMTGEGPEARRARRRARKIKQTTAEEPETNHEARRVPPPSLAGDMTMYASKARNREKNKSRSTGSGLTRSNSDDGPSLVSQDLKVNTPRRAESVRVGNDTRSTSPDELRKVTRKEVRKASKFASLDDDGSDFDDDPIEIQAIPAPSRPDRPSMMSKARSATNVFGKATRKMKEQVVKKAKALA